MLHNTIPYYFGLAPIPEHLKFEFPYIQNLDQDEHCLTNPRLWRAIRTNQFQDEKPRILVLTFPMR